ncbi:MAG: hypothetical protein Q9183_004932 [Haloplaca sp. 2 TL-2023]
MPTRRSIIVLACFVLLSAIVLTVHQIERHSPGSIEHLLPPKLIHTTQYGQEAENVTSHCGKGIEWLDKLDVPYPISYAQRDIVVRPSAGAKRMSLTKVKGPLFPQEKDILVTQESHLALRDCQQPLVLEVPDTPLEPVDASRMHFGIATTLDRLKDSTPTIARWLTHTRAKLFVVIVAPEKPPAATSKQIAEWEKEMRERGMDVTLMSPIKKYQSYTENYFSLAKIMYTHRTKEASWFVLMDDDTFYPSMRALLAMLDKYDPDQQYWIGAVSDQWWSVARFGMMAFGGAGIFLSRGLAAVIDEVYEDCTKTIHKAAGGDERVMRCVTMNTETKLTNEPALHQMDVFGDLSGIYESGRFPLSLHHWKGGEYQVDKMSLASDICGDCVLQRWQFGDDTVLTNGFSIARYPNGKKANGLNFFKAEETWNAHTVEASVNPGTMHSLEPVRPRLELDKDKIQYRLLESAVVDGGIRQAYIHRAKEGEGSTVLVLYWKRETDGVESADSPPPG